MGETEISLGPVKLKGKDAFAYLGWLVAVGSMAYASYGPPNSIREEQTKQGSSIQALTVDMAVVKTDVASLKKDLAPFVEAGKQQRRAEALARVERQRVIEEFDK